MATGTAKRLNIWDEHHLSVERILAQQETLDDVCVMIADPGDEAGKGISSALAELLDCAQSISDQWEHWAKQGKSQVTISLMPVELAAALIDDPSPSGAYALRNTSSPGKVSIVIVSAGGTMTGTIDAPEKAKGAYLA
jgi:hypothetical protein